MELLDCSPLYDTPLQSTGAGVGVGADALKSADKSCDQCYECVGVSFGSSGRKSGAHSVCGAPFATGVSVNVNVRWSSLYIEHSSRPHSNRIDSIGLAPLARRSSQLRVGVARGSRGRQWACSAWSALRAAQDGPRAELLLPGGNRPQPRRPPPPPPPPHLWRPERLIEVLWRPLKSSGGANARRGLIAQ